MLEKHQETHSFSEIELQRAIIISIEVFVQNDWLVEHISASEVIGFASKKSKAEKVIVLADQNVLTISSESLEDEEITKDKHRENVSTFISSFESVKDSISEERIKQHQAVIQEYGVRIQKTKGATNMLEQKSFLPSKDFIVVPVIVAINVLVFILMIVNGVDAVSPKTLDLIDWGANLRSLTTDGDWWRLITCCFLHIGFFHLLMNMYFLLYIGTHLEPMLGKWKFTITYLLTGVLASLASLYWHENTTSAGASGAIFGMFGLFIALLTTDLIPKQARMPMLKSFGLILVINLLYGMNAGVDNAAHIGGLISGILIGYALYPILKSGDQKSTGMKILAAFSIVTLILCYFGLSQLSTDDVKFSNDISKFETLEKEALKTYKNSESFSPFEYQVSLSSNSMPKWKKGLLIFTNAASYNLSDNAESSRQRYEEYCTLRISFDSLVILGIKEDTDIYQSELEEYIHQIEEISKKPTL